MGNGINSTVTDGDETFGGGEHAKARTEIKTKPLGSVVTGVMDPVGFVVCAPNGRNYNILQEVSENRD